MMNLHSMVLKLDANSLTPIHDNACGCVSNLARQRQDTKMILPLVIDRVNIFK